MKISRVDGEEKNMKITIDGEESTGHRILLLGMMQNATKKSSDGKRSIYQWRNHTQAITGNRNRNLKTSKALLKS